MPSECPIMDSVTFLRKGLQMLVIKVKTLNSIVLNGDGFPGLKQSCHIVSARVEEFLEGHALLLNPWPQSYMFSLLCKHPNIIVEI
jgi:hypothetical protein